MYGLSRLHTSEHIPQPTGESARVIWTGGKVAELISTTYRAPVLILEMKSPIEWCKSARQLIASLRASIFIKPPKKAPGNCPHLRSQSTVRTHPHRIQLHLSSRQSPRERLAARRLL